MEYISTLRLRYVFEPLINKADNLSEPNVASAQSNVTFPFDDVPFSRTIFSLNEGLFYIQPVYATDDTV